jgi:hypothetical protein
MATSTEPDTRPIVAYVASLDLMKVVQPQNSLTALIFFIGIITSSF